MFICTLYSCVLLTCDCLFSAVLLCLYIFMLYSCVMDTFCVVVSITQLYNINIYKHNKTTENKQSHVNNTQLYRVHINISRVHRPHKRYPSHSCITPFVWSVYSWYVYMYSIQLCVVNIWLFVFCGFAMFIYIYVKSTQTTQKVSIIQLYNINIYKHNKTTQTANNQMLTTHSCIEYILLSVWFCYVYIYLCYTAVWWIPFVWSVYSWYVYTHSCIEYI
jgi:hypothetical protein